MLQANIDTIKTEFREVTKNMETVQMKNYITQKYMKMVMCDNKLKTKNGTLKAELEALKSKLAYSNLTKNNTYQINEELKAEVVLQEYEAQHKSVESVASKLLMVNCSKHWNKCASDLKRSTNL